MVLVMAPRGEPAAAAPIPVKKDEAEPQPA